MPKKKLLEVSKEFVDLVLSIIANESEEGRKKIVAIARRAEIKYELPVKSWITGWFYQYTRTRGEKVEQSINVMENFPDAYTRLQEFKLMISEGEWNVSSYNYYLFLELIDAVPDYQPLEEHLIHTFVMELRDHVIIQINSFMAQYKATLEEIKNREIERQTARQSARQLVENVMVFNNLDAAKNCQSTQQDQFAFSLSYKDEKWNLSWVDETGKVFPLTPGDELAQKLATLEDQDVEKLNAVHLRRIKRECLKAREEYLAKVQLLINPENPKTHGPLNNDELVESGTTSTFVLRRTETETNLWWINTLGVPNKISLTDYPKLDSWLATHKDALTETDILQLKAHLMQLNTAQSIASQKLDKMNSMLSHVFQKRDKQEQRAIDKTEESQGKINLKPFALIEQHLKVRSEKMASDKRTISKSKLEVVEETTKEEGHKKLDKSRYAALSQLPTFWQQRRIAEEQAALSETQSLICP